jgi:SAM-dependent methyltransferase
MIVQRKAIEQFARLEGEHWWLRGRRAVYLGLLEHSLAGRRPARALDLGCGPGGFLPGLERLCGAVIAADSDFESLRSVDARRRVLTVAESLPFAAESLDLVCAFDVIEHVDDLCALREIQRVLMPGGTLALSVPAYPWLYSNNDRVVMHRRRYTRKSLAAALEQSGFELVRNTHSNVLLAPLIV